MLTDPSIANRPNVRPLNYWVACHRMAIPGDSRKDAQVARLVALLQEHDRQDIERYLQLVSDLAHELVATVRNNAAYRALQPGIMQSGAAQGSAVSTDASQAPNYIPTSSLVEAVILSRLV